MVKIITSVNDDSIEKVKETVLINRRYWIKKITENLNISYKSTSQVLVNVLGIRRGRTKSPESFAKPSSSSDACRKRDARQRS